MPHATLIKKDQSKLVDLGTKKIYKYTAPDNKLEINRMEMFGRNPENPEHFILETAVHFMIYVTSGTGRIYCDDEIFEVQVADVVDVPQSVMFAAESTSTDFTYLVCETPAWFPEQASIVTKDGELVEQTKI